MPAYSQSLVRACIFQSVVISPRKYQLPKWLEERIGISFFFLIVFILVVEYRYFFKGFWYPTLLLYPPYPKDRGMLWFYVEAASVRNRFEK